MHGMSGTRVYHIWAGMKSRCLNPKHCKYYMYGGAGISVCERWQSSFQNFYDDMGDPPSLQHSLDRYPNHSGNYEPGNCRWATKKEQMENTKRTRLVTMNGETHSLKEWSRILGIPYNTLSNRINRSGMTPEQAFAHKKNQQSKPHDGGWNKKRQTPSTA